MALSIKQCFILLGQFAVLGFVFITLAYSLTQKKVPFERMKPVKPIFAQRDTHILTGNWESLTSFKIPNEHICTGLNNLTFIVVVHSAVHNYNNRRVIRNTWACPQNYREVNFRTVFFLGLPKDDKMQSLIESENSQYNDIVQGNFLDTYRNLTLKGVTLYRWVKEFCSHAKMVLKVDDDVYVNLFELVKYHLPSIRNQSKKIVCTTFYNAPVIRRPNKWRVTEEELPGQKVYPTYCLGCLVLMTPDVVDLMLENVPKYPFFWIDDVYLYGNLLQKQNVTYIQNRKEISLSFYACNSSLSKNVAGLINHGCLNIHNSRHMEELWRKTLTRYSSDSLLNQYALRTWS